MAGENILKDMQVIASDGGMVGEVDGVEGDRIKLKRASELGGGGHHFIPLSWVARVDEHVHLDREAALVRDSWTGEGLGAGATAAGATAAGATTAAAAPRVDVHDDDRKTNWLPWLLGLGALALAFFLFTRGCEDGRENRVEENVTTNVVDETTAVGAGTAATAADVRAYLAGTAAAPSTFTFEQLNFATASAEIPAGNREELAELGRALAGGASRVKIVGYADALGAAEANATLGQRRAQAVADALSAAGVDKGRIEVESGGETNPQATNETAPGRSENRRTELVLLSR